MLLGKVELSCYHASAAWVYTYWQNVILQCCMRVCCVSHVCHICCCRAATWHALHQTQLTAEKLDMPVLAVLFCIGIEKAHFHGSAKPLTPFEVSPYAVLFRPLLIRVNICHNTSSIQWLIKGYVCLICRCSIGLNVALILLFLFLALFNFLAAAGQFVPNCLKASTMTIDHELCMCCIHV